MLGKNKRYILHHKIAMGGMAEIYLGKQIGEDGFARLCCIKRILPEYAKEQSFVNMFRDEAHISKRLQHTNIVRIEGFEEVQASYALIMEFINGCDLQSVLKNCIKQNIKLPIPMIIYIVAESCRGLHYAHTRIDEITNKNLDIIHRDISPQNIMVSFEGEVKVTDFGIAKSKQKKEEKTKTGIVKGKYSYMSPEQIQGKDLDPSSDVYALAVVMWESLALKRLFQGNTELETIQNVSKGSIKEDIRKLNNEIDEKLFSILNKGLSFQIEDRYNNANAFEKALREYLNHKFPKFTPQDLSLFLKGIMSEKKEEYSSYIRSVLSEDKEIKATQNETTETDQEQTIVEQEKTIITPSTDKTEQIKTIVKADPKRKRKKISSAHKKPYNVVTQYLSAAIIGALITGAIYGYYIKAIGTTGYTSLEIGTNPKIVKLSLNQTPLFEGNYIKTPIKIGNLTAKEHILTVEKEGFFPKKIKITGKKNKRIVKNNISLSKSYLKSSAIVKITTKHTQDTMIIVNDGIFFTKLRSGVQTVIPEISTNNENTLTILPLYPSKENAFLCKFFAKPQKNSTTTNINIDINKRICISRK